MKISILWRLILSHGIILFLSGAICFYSIVQLGSLGQTARSALEVDHRMTAYQEGLADAFLSEVRYGGKFLITYNESRYEQLRQFRKDFDEYLRQLRELDDSQSIGTSLSKIERLHAQYDLLFGREIEYVRARQNYAQSRFQQERDKIIENTLGELDQLKAELRSKLQHKIEIIDQGARKARNVAIAAFLVVLVLGVWISINVSATSRLHSAPLPRPRRAGTLVRLASRAR